MKHLAHKISYSFVVVNFVSLVRLTLTHVRFIYHFGKIRQGIEQKINDSNLFASLFDIKTRSMLLLYLLLTVWFTILAVVSGTRNQNGIIRIEDGLIV